MLPTTTTNEHPHYDWRRLRDPSQPRGDNRIWRARLTSLVLTDPEVREDGRRVCRNNLLALCYTLGFCLITPESHHEALAFFPEIDSDNKSVEEIAQGITKRRSLILPRGTFKTTLNLSFCTQLILHYYETIAILILSGSKELAHAFVNEIASFFIKRPRVAPTLFQALFPELCISSLPPSGQFTAHIRQHEPEIIEPLIWGNSVDSATTGWHPDVLIVDDLVTNRTGKSYEGRRRITKAYKLVRKILKPTGIEIKLGTPYGVGDIFNDELMTSKPGTYERVYKPALQLHSGERLDANGFPPEEDMTLLFKSILNYDFLKEEYDADYESFMSQLMLDTYGAAEIVFGESDLLAAMVDEAKVPLEGEPHIVFRVPSKSLRWRTTNCAVGMMHKDRMYIVEAEQGYFKPSGIAKLINDTARKYGTHRVSIIESPGAITMQPFIENYALTSGWTIHVDWIEFEEDYGIRDTRIRNIEAEIAQKRLLFSSAIKTKPLVHGFLEYGQIEETGLPHVIAHIADYLPKSLAAQEEADKESWEMMRERDKYNYIYGLGRYAPPEPEEEETEAQEEEWPKVGENGLEILIPGLEY